jgi:glycosyltransferase involved in cell wall biosynthesis
LRILIVTHQFPPYQFGGSGTYALDLAASLLRKDHEVMVVCGNRNPPVWERHDRSSVLRVSVPQVPFRHLWFEVANRDQILRLAHKADVVHAQQISCSLLIRQIARDKPVVTTIDGSHREILRATTRLPLSDATLSEIMTSVLAEPVQTYMRNLDIRDSTHLAVQSEYVKTEITSHGLLHDSSKVSIIPSAIDFNELKPILELGKSPSRTRNLVFVGRLFWSKGVTFAVRAMKLIAGDMKERDVTLSVVGTGPLKKKLTEMVRRMKLENTVRLMGPIPRSEVLKTMHASDALVLPSLYEACPRVLLEAKALGLPTALFDLPWTPSFARLGIQSQLAKPMDHVDLARKMLIAARTPKQEGVLDQLKSFDMNEVASRLTELYHKLTHDP